METLAELFAIALAMFIIKGSIDIGKEIVRGITWIARAAYKEMADNSHDEEL